MNVDFWPELDKFIFSLWVHLNFFLALCWLLYIVSPCNNHRNLEECTASLLRAPCVAAVSASEAEVGHLTSQSTGLLQSVSVAHPANTSGGSHCILFFFHMKNRVHLSHIRLFLFLLYLYLTTQPHAAVTQAAMSRDTDPSSQSAACRCSAHIQDQLYLLNIFITCSYIKKICLYCGFLFLLPPLSFHLSTSMSFIALPTDARIFLLTLGCLAICAGIKQLHLLIKARTAREIYIGRLHCSKTPD